MSQQNYNCCIDCICGIILLVADLFLPRVITHNHDFLTNPIYIYKLPVHLSILLISGNVYSSKSVSLPLSMLRFVVDSFTN
jgi:hypothetical protein